MRIDRNTPRGLVRASGPSARYHLKRIRAELVQRHGLAELPRDAQLAAVQAANATAEGNPDKVLRYLTAAHRACEQAVRCAAKQRTAKPVPGVLGQLAAKPSPELSPVDRVLKGLS